jgi:hypothetical protein
MAVSGSNLRALFSNRKKRSNAGKKRGPRKAAVLKPTNVIVVNNGGVAKVMSPPKPKGRGRTVGPLFVGPLRPQNTRKVRKTRSNKGVKRGPRYLPRNTGLFM